MQTFYHISNIQIFLVSVMVETLPHRFIVVFFPSAFSIVPDTRSCDKKVSKKTSNVVTNQFLTARHFVRHFLYMFNFERTNNAKYDNHLNTADAKSFTKLDLDEKNLRTKYEATQTVGKTLQY